ncbi:MAG: WcbI family polysaccharide biosynthesis putative acetyltransferase, partial [Humidesulfovibrio sp.]|nr:WcbI family polysaccharide biosynthesis putative acetyltransferase [Humidesulfovibrio sp.]
LDALLAETVARETERQSHTPVRYLDFVLEHWRKRPLFLSVNHPGPELLQLAAAGILGQLGLAPPTPELLPEAGALGEGYADFELPVHPQAAAFYGLAYGGEGSAFNVYGKARTAAQYAAAYVDCRLAGENDFISYLQLV